MREKEKGEYKWKSNFTSSYFWFCTFKLICIYVQSWFRLDGHINSADFYNVAGITDIWQVSKSLAHFQNSWSILLTVTKHTQHLEKSPVDLLFFFLHFVIPSNKSFHVIPAKERHWFLCLQESLTMALCNDGYRLLNKTKNTTQESLISYVSSRECWDIKKTFSFNSIYRTFVW